MTDGPAGNAVLYEPDDRPAAAMTISLGTQYAFFALGGIIMVPLLIFRAAGVPADVLTWAVFASILVCGLVTMTLAFRFWRIGAGYILMTNTTGTAIAVGVDAVSAGGVALLGSLVLVCSLLQFALSFRLSLLRRVVTPTVSGVVLMLIPVTVMPVVFERLDDVPAGAAASAVCALATLVAVGGIMVKGGPKLRPWAPLIGLGLGAATSVAFGLYDTEGVLAAGWIGIPQTTPELRFDFGADFFRLLPAFMLVFIVCTVRTTSASLAIQGVSWRLPRTVDFRPVQGAVAADAVGNALAGLAGTVPNCVRATTVSLTELTGVAARRVGIAAGSVLLLVAFLPKVPALVIAVPGPVIAGYITVVTATIFTLGMKMIVADGLDTQKTLVVALSFWIGVGCEYGLIFPKIVPHLVGGLMSSGLTAGGLVAIALSAVFELTAARRRRLETELGVSALPAIQTFLRGFCREQRLGRSDGGPARRGGGGDSADTRSRPRRTGQDAAAAARGGLPRWARRDVGVHCGGRRREHRGPARIAQGGSVGRCGRAGRLAAAVTPSRRGGPASPVPRCGLHLGTGGSGGAHVSRTRRCTRLARRRAGRMRNRTPGRRGASG